MAHGRRLFFCLKSKKTPWLQTVSIYSIESIDKIWTSLEYMHTYCIRWWSNKESCKNNFTWQNVTDKNETALTTWHQYKSGILWVHLWRNLTFLSECQIFGSTMAGQSVSGHRSVSEGVRVIYRTPHSTLVQGTPCSRRSRSHSDQWVCSPLCLPYHWNINSQPSSTVYSGVGVGVYWCSCTNTM